MSYFGSIYFNMPNGLQCGLKTVFDDGRIVKGEVKPKLYRQGELSFIPLRNIKETYVSCNNSTPCDSNEKINGYKCSELDARFKVKKNSTIFRLENNQIFAWGDNSDGQIGLGKDIQFCDSPQLLNIDCVNVKKIARPFNKSNMCNATYFVMNDGKVKGCGKGLIGYIETQYDIVDIPSLTDIKDMYVLTNNIFIVKNNNDIYKKGTDTDFELVGNYGNGLKQIDEYVYCEKTKNIFYIYNSGVLLSEGENTTFVRNGNRIGLFEDNSSHISITKTRFDNVLKSQNGIIMFKDNNISYLQSYRELKVKDFYHYTYNKSDGYGSTIDDDVLYYIDYNTDKLVTTQYNYKDSDNISFYPNKRVKGRFNNENRYIVDFQLENVRNWTITENQRCKFKAELWKNANTYLCDIPQEYIEKIEYKIGLDLNTFELNVPKYMQGTERINEVYKLIKPKQQVIIRDINNVKQRFILEPSSNVYTRNNGYKTFTANSSEKAIMKTKYQITDNYYQLYNDEEGNDGILNTIFKNCSYDIGCVEVDARKKYLSNNKTITYNRIKPSNICISDTYPLQCVKYDISYDDILYTYYCDEPSIKKNRDTWGNNDDINYRVKTDNKQCGLNLALVYNNVVVGEVDNKETKNKVEYGTIYINFDDVFYDKIVSIQAKVTNKVGNRNAITHIITMENGETKEFVNEFVKCANESDKDKEYAPKRFITWDSVDITFTTGERVKEKDTLYLKYEDDSGTDIQNALTDIQDNYLVYFEFDTVNRFVHCFSSQMSDISLDIDNRLGDFVLGKSTLGSKNDLVRSKIELSSDDITKVEINENEDNILTGYRVTGKDDLSIIKANPLGTDVIENYNYFIDNDLLSEDTIEAYNTYLKVLQDKKNNWDLLLKDYNNITTQSIENQSQLTALETRIQAETISRDTYIKNTDNKQAQESQTKLDEYTNKYNSLKQEKENTDKKINEIEEQMKNYANSVSKENIQYAGENIFTWSQLQEFEDISNIEDVDDSFFTDSEQLYEYYKYKLEQQIKNRIDIKTTNNNMIKYYKYVDNAINLGNIYDLDDYLIKQLGIKKLKLISYIYYPNKDVYGSIEELNFSNKEEVINPYKAFRKNGGVVATNKNTKAITQLNNSTNVNSNTITSKLATETYTLNQANLNNLNTANFRVGLEINVPIVLYTEYKEDKFRPYIKLDDSYDLNDIVKKYNIHINGSEMTLQSGLKNTSIYDIYITNNKTTTKIPYLPDYNIESNNYLNMPISKVMVESQIYNGGQINITFHTSGLEAILDKKYILKILVYQNFGATNELKIK